MGSPRFQRAITMAAIDAFPFELVGGEVGQGAGIAGVHAGVLPPENCINRFDLHEIS